MEITAFAVRLKLRKRPFIVFVKPSTSEVTPLKTEEAAALSGLDLKANALQPGSIRVCTDLMHGAYVPHHFSTTFTLSKGHFLWGATGWLICLPAFSSLQRAGLEQNSCFQLKRTEKVVRQGEMRRICGISYMKAPSVCLGNSPKLNYLREKLIRAKRLSLMRKFETEHFGGVRTEDWMLHNCKQ